MLAQAASNLPPEYDFVSDGLSGGERAILDWADSRLFSNPAFLESRWGPERWPVVQGGMTPSQARTQDGRVLSDEEIRVASAQAVIALMREMDIEKKADGHHVVSWGVDGLDRVLDALGVYPGMCVHCYGKSGYDTYEGLDANYGVILEQGHVHREMLKAFAYFARADGEGILVRSFMDNDAEDFDLLYKRRMDRFPTVVGTASFAYEHVSFMSQIRLPEGELVSYPTMVFGMVGNAGGEREAVERVYDHMRKALTHYTGGKEDFREIYAPYTVTPYSPELGWIVYVGEAGSPSSSGTITGALRALGLRAEQFMTPRNRARAGSVEADGVWYYYDGNNFLGEDIETAPICVLFRTNLDWVEDYKYDLDCDK